MTAPRQRKKMELPVLNYERLLAGDKLETQKMINALSGQGLFFLDLDGPTCKQSLEDLGPVYRQQRKFFEEPMEVKNRYHSGLRYKGFYTFDSGVEKIHLGREEHVNKTLDLPTALLPVEDKVSSSSEFIDTLLRQLGTRLCSAMEPPVPARLDDAANPGLSNLYLAISKVERGKFIMTSHRDDGFLTLTFYDEPFLEVRDRETEEWKLVDVNKHMPIVNVGEELEANSKGRLHAPYHQCYQGDNEIDLIMFDLFESPLKAE